MGADRQRRARLRLTVQYDEDEGEPPSPPAVRRALKAALCEPAELTVRFVDRQSARRLNRRFRAKPRASNVLAFPLSQEGEPLCGDIAICSAVVESEARELSIPSKFHYAHMLVHAALHLSGCRHDDCAAAASMEKREIGALAELGIPDPYRSG